MYRNTVMRSSFANCSVAKYLFHNGRKNRAFAANAYKKRWYSLSAEGKSYDYIVVGAGSAGCVLANRLSKDENNSVLVMEAGAKDTSWKIHMPAALMYTLFNPNYNWCYNTIPQKHMNNRQMYWPRAKMWGGCSGHNAMVYVRGHAHDYDNWEKLGAQGWSYADILPYFKRSQTHELGEDNYRGGDGPLYVSRGYYIEENPLFDAFIQAGVQAGYPYTDDMNGYQQEGFGYMDMTIKKGIRWSTSLGYLRPVLYRQNLDVSSVAMVNRILFDGKKAIGVEYKQGGLVQKVFANKEVILSAGAINSPQLLMLSGVGDADELKEHDIPIIQHLPGVGKNLQDHLEVYIQHECTEPITLYKYQWKFPHIMVQTGLEWFLSHTGPASTAHLEAGAFVRSRPELNQPDIQYHFLPSVVINHGSGLGSCHAFQVHVGPMRPTSVGTVKLKSKDPLEHPIIDANYLATEQDRIEFRDSVRITKELFKQKAFEPFIGPEILPGSECKTDAEIDAFIRAKGDSAYHPSCTCKIGSESDKLAVVDPKCQVYGVEGLRVVDASIMPQVVSGNLNGPVVMLAEKAADIILDNDPLPRSSAPVYKASNTSTKVK